MSQCGYCNDLPTAAFVNDACANPEGGIKAVVFVKCSTWGSFTDPEDGSEWDTAIAALNAFSIKPVTGQYDGPEYATADGWGDAPERNTAKDYTVTFTHPNVNTVSGGVYSNRDFYNAMSKSSGAYYFGFITFDNVLKVINGVCNVKPKDMTDEKGGTQHWEVEIVARDEDLPLYYAAPLTLYSV